MTEKWALILTVAGGTAAFLITAIAIKMIGGNYEPMAVAGFFWMCVTAWESSGVVMRYAAKRREAGQPRR